MAKVYMLTQISGTRDGADWPARGDILDCPADEAAQLIGQGAASTDKPDLRNRVLTAGVEAAVPDAPAETAAVDTQPAKKTATKRA